MQSDTNSSRFPDTSLDKLLAAHPVEASRDFVLKLHARIAAEDSVLDQKIDLLLCAQEQQATPHFLWNLRSKIEAEHRKPTRSIAFWARSAVAFGSIAALFALSFIQNYDAPQQEASETVSYAFTPSDQELTRIFALAGSLEAAPDLLAADSGFDAIALLMD